MTAQTCLTLESRPTQADHLVEAKITWAGFDLQHRHGVVRPFSPRDSVGSQGVRHWWHGLLPHQNGSCGTTAVVSEPSHEFDSLHRSPSSTRRLAILPRCLVQAFRRPVVEASDCVVISRSIRGIGREPIL